MELKIEYEVAKWKCKQLYLHKHTESKKKTAGEYVRNRKMYNSLYNRKLTME